MAREKDSVILYQSFFDATAGLKASAKAELWDCIGKYLNGVAHKFKDSSAELAWNIIVRQLDADRQKYQAKCQRNRENGNRGGRPQRISPENNGEKREEENPEKPNGFYENPNKPNGFFQNPTDTDTDTDSDTDSDKRKNIDKKENGFCLNDFIAAAKLPYVSATEEQARECFDFYAAQGFLKSNGQPITAVAPLLRAWKRREGMFGANKNGPHGQNSPDLRTLKLGLKFILGGSDNLLPHEQKALACQDAESFKRYVPDEYALIVDTLKEPFSKMKDFINKNLK